MAKKGIKQNIAENKVGILGGLCMLLLMATGFFVLYKIDLMAFVAKYQGSSFGLFVVLGIFVVKALTVFVIPQLVCFGAVGLLYPPKAAIFIGLIGLVMEYSINYFIGKNLGKKALDKLWNVLQKRGINKISMTPFGIITLYVLPGPSRDLMGMVFGAIDMQYYHFMPWAIIGSLHRLIMVALLGNAAVDPFSPQFILILVLLLFINWLLRRIKKAREEKIAQLEQKRIEREKEEEE